MTKTTIILLVLIITVLVSYTLNASKNNMNFNDSEISSALEKLEKDIVSLFKGVNHDINKSWLPHFGKKANGFSDGYADTRVEYDGHYWLMYTPVRNQNNVTIKTDDYNEINYAIVKHQISAAAEIEILKVNGEFNKNKYSGKYRKIRYRKQLEMISAMNLEWGRDYKEYLKESLRESPYDLKNEERDEYINSLVVKQHLNYRDALESALLKYPKPVPEVDPEI